MWHTNVEIFTCPALQYSHVPALLPPQSVRIWPSGHAAHDLHTLCSVSSWYRRSAPSQLIFTVLPSHLCPFGHTAQPRFDVVVAAVASNSPGRHTRWSSHSRFDVVVAALVCHCVEVHCRCDAQTRFDVAVGGLVSYCVAVQVLTGLQLALAESSCQNETPSQALQPLEPVPSWYCPTLHRVQVCRDGLRLSTLSATLL